MLNKTLIFNSKFYNPFSRSIPHFFSRENTTKKVGDFFTRFFDTRWKKGALAMFTLGSFHIANELLEKTSPVKYAVFSTFFENEGLFDLRRAEESFREAVLVIEKVLALSIQEATATGDTTELETFVKDLKNLNHRYFLFRTNNGSVSIAGGPSLEFKELIKKYPFLYKESISEPVFDNLISQATNAIDSIKNIH